MVTDSNDVMEKFNPNPEKLMSLGIVDDHALSTFLAEYLDTLSQMGICDIRLNFVRAAVVLESSVKLFGIKVDKLEESEEFLLQTLIQRSEKKRKGQKEIEDGADEGEVADEPPEKSAPVAHRRRGRRTKDIIGEEDFFEVDNACSGSAKHVNGKLAADEYKLCFLERNLNIFSKNKGKKRVDVRLKKVEDKDESRMRDWVLNLDFMIQRELFSDTGMSDESRFRDFQELSACEERLGAAEDDWLDQIPLTPAPSEGNDGYSSSVSEISYREGCVKTKQVALVDWDVDKNTIDDRMQAKKLKTGNTTRPPCELCNSKKPHKKGGKKCTEKGPETLDNFFHPFVQPNVTDPLYGNLPDQELYSLYKEEMETLAKTKRLSRVPSLDAFEHPKDGRFDGFNAEEDEVQRCNVSVNDDDGDNGDLGFDLPPVDDFQSLIPDDARSIASSGHRIGEELTEVETAQKRFERNKQLALKISQWHNSLADKISLAERRGALDMDLLAARVMSHFPAKEERPTISFQNMVKEQTRKDVPRFFFACLQLTNEGNIDINKTTNGMVLERLRETRIKELDDYNADQPATSGTKRSYTNSESGETKKRAKVAKSKK